MYEKCACSELFWFDFSHIWAEYREIFRISPYSIRMRENTDQKNSEYSHFCAVCNFKVMPLFEKYLKFLPNEIFSFSRLVKNNLHIGQKVEKTTILFTKELYVNNLVANDTINID